MPQGKSIIVSAPSGAGKTTIVRKLLKRQSDIQFSVSACNRKKRHNETNGKDYYFLTTKDFKKKIDNNEFIEWEEVYPGQYYGTLKSEVQRIWNNGNTVIYDVDVVGGLNLKQKLGNNALALFIMPPSIEILSKRLRDRNTETKEKLHLRIDKAEIEIKRAGEFDKIVVNDDLAHAINDTINFVREFTKR